MTKVVKLLLSNIISKVPFSNKPETYLQKLFIFENPIFPSSLDFIKDKNFINPSTILLF